MKVCMIVPNKFVKGGISSVTNGYRQNNYFNNKVNIKYIESYIDGNKIKKFFKALFSYFEFLFYIIFNRPDIVHIHSSFGPSFYRKKVFIDIAYIFKIKIINHIHGADFTSFYINASNKKKRIIKKTYNKCDYLIALSEEWKENLSIIVKKDKIKIVENYCITKANSIRSSNLNNTVLFLGEICERKGCFNIPKIAFEIKKHIPNIRFIIAGQGTLNNENKFKLLINEYNLKENIQMVGWIRDQEKNDALSKSDVFLLPSYNEGMPMAILDAMGYSLPIVSTNVGGIPQIVINGVNGFVCDPSNYLEIANLIIKILTDDKLYSQMSKKSYDLAIEKYSIKQNLDKILEIYNSLINHSN